MICRITVSTLLLLALPFPALGQPAIQITAAGLQGGDFAWDVGFVPDLTLAGSSTPIAVEFGLRLRGASLLSATNVNPLEFDTPIPGSPIFGWETLTDVDPGVGVNLKPMGLQANTSTGEVFAAFGSAVFGTPGAKPFLRVLTQGPENGGTASTSTIEWLGTYAGDKGRIAQLVSQDRAVNFDIISGTASQSVTPFDAADFDRDRDVDGADLAVWTLHFGTAAGAAAADGDADGDADVDGGDLLVWQRQYLGTTATGAFAVPEPGSAWMVLAWAAAWFGARAGRRARSGAACPTVWSLEGSRLP
jgi:hypothetical protein